MKKILRRIMFVKSYLYIYPYSLLNFDNDLQRILDAKYLNKNINLRGKYLSKNQFSLWEKWNFFRGNYSYDAFSFFSGTKYSENNKTYIIGTIYPNPIYIIGFYFALISLILIIFNCIVIYETKMAKEVLLSLGLISILFYSISIYFRRRIQKTVETELILEKTQNIRPNTKNT